MVSLPGLLLRAGAANRRLDFARPGCAGRADRGVTSNTRVLPQGRCRCLRGDASSLLLRDAAVGARQWARRRVVKALRLRAGPCSRMPVIWVAVDTLLAHLHARRQLGQPGLHAGGSSAGVRSSASVFGVGGVLFVLMLVNSALALALHRGLRCRARCRRIQPRSPCSSLRVGASAWWRLQAPVETALATNFGIVSIDDFLLAADSDRSARSLAAIRRAGDRAGRRRRRHHPVAGKIAVLGAADAEARKTHCLSELAAANPCVAGGRARASTTASSGATKPGGSRPTAGCVTNYLKHFMAPPGASFVSGSEYPRESPSTA